MTVGCSSSGVGRGAPSSTAAAPTSSTADSTTATTTSAATPASPARAAPDERLRALDPCSWVTDAEAAELFGGPVGHKYLAVELRPGCYWIDRAWRLTVYHHLVPGLGPRLSPDVVIERSTVGRHQVNRHERLDLHCSAELVMSPTSSVVVEATVRPGGPKDEPCELAEPAVALIEPKLPPPAGG